MVAGARGDAAFQRELWNADRTNAHQESVSPQAAATFGSAVFAR
jgi:hypothetical protein